MTILMRIPSKLVREARRDLLREHPFAHERIGYFACKPAGLPEDQLLLCAYKYLPVADDHYVDDPSVGALIGADGLRAAMQVAYSEQASLFHVHMHVHRGAPWFGRYDLEQNHQFVPDMFNVAAGVPHGALVMSYDEIAGLCWWRRGEKPAVISRVVEVGAPLISFRRSA
jgi:hypothetical protein